MSVTQRGLRPSLRSNFYWTFAGTAIYAICQWGMLSVLSKLRSPTDVGIFVYGLAVATPTYVLAQLQLRSIQATDVTQRFSFCTYLTVRIICVVIASVVILAIVFFTHPDRITMWTCLFFAGGRAAESVSDILYGAMQLNEQMRTQAASMCLKGLVSLALLVIALQTWHSVAGAALGIMIAWTAVLVAYDIPSTARMFRSLHRGGIRPRTVSIRRAWSVGEIKPLLRDALPMGLVMFLLSLNANIPRYVLKAETDMKTLGIYAALSYIQVGGMVVVSALGQAAAPKLARLYQFGDMDSFLVLLKKLVGVGGTLGALGVLGVSVCGNMALTLLYKAEYARFQREFVVMSIGSGLMYVTCVLGCGMTSMRCYYQQLVTIGSSTVVLMACCTWLVPRYGLLGAADASLVSSGVMAVLSGIAVLAEMRRKSKVAVSVAIPIARTVEVQ